MRKSALQFWCAGSFAVGLLSISPTQAQIVPDNTLPVNSQVRGCGSAACTVINGGTVREANLFHSFRQFSIPTGGEAHFNNAAQIQNILTRVTGTSLSNIDGLIRANGIANLYLVNPNGIVFGPNASLNIGGSFVATTAGSLKLPDGSEYSALNPQAPPLLAVNLAPGVQYGARPTGSTITNAGNLAVPTKQSITLLGGTTTSTGTLAAPGGRVQVLGDQVALQDNARVDVSSPTAGGTVLIGGDYKGQGAVPNSQSTEVGQNVVIKADAVTNGNGGKVIVWSDGNTRFDGMITSQGGLQGGNGGLVETSGRVTLTIGDEATVNTFAPLGQTGTWLLDPANLTIVKTGTGTGTIGSDGTNSPADSTINDTTINEAIKRSNVTLSATNLIEVETVVVGAESQFSLTFAAPTINVSNSRIYNVGNGNIILDTTTNPGTRISITDSVIDTTPPSSAKEGDKGGDILIRTGNLNITNINNQKTIIQTISRIGSEFGSTGNISIIASGDIAIKGNNSSRDNLSIFSILQSKGKGGDVSVIGNSLSMSGGSTINASTFGTGDAGSVTVNIAGRVILDNASIFTAVGKPGVPAKGNAGKIDLSADSILLKDRAEINSDTRSEGNAGLIKLTINGEANFDGISSGISSRVIGSEGKGGVIELSANALSLTNKAVITATTDAAGQGGSIALIGNTVSLASDAQVTASTSYLGVPGDSKGNAGAITFNTPTLTVAGGAKVSAETTGSGRGGTITVNAPTTVNLRRVQGYSPVISVETSAAGKAGDIVINTPTLILSDAAKITATATATATNLEGGGSVTLNASNIDLAGGTVGVFANTNSIAPAGTLSLKPYDGQALNVTFAPGSVISASTSSSGKGGDLNLTAPRSITLDGPGTLSVETTGSGNAGNIVVTTQQLTLTKGVQLTATTSNTGKGGNIGITANTVMIRDGAKIAVNSQSTGDAGDITITAPSRITLDNHALITASSTSGQGGNIIIDPDILLLRRGSQISTSAGSNNTPGNGGNIDITAGFVVGLLSENSDIVAEAFTGNGGRITINANRVFGFIPSPPKTSTTRFSDINASSALGVSGVVILNTLNLDPSQGLGELNLIPIDSSNLVAKSCATGKREALNENRFAATGRSGLPASPDDVFRNSSVLTELGTPTTTETSANTPNSSAPASSPSPNTIVEAQGWTIAPNGKVRLVARAPSVSPTSFQQPRLTCPDDSSSLRP